MQTKSTITLPTSFASACFVVMCTPKLSVDNDGVIASAYGYPTSKSQITCIHDSYSGGRDIFAIMWVALGQ